MIISWNVNLPRHRSLWDTIVAAYNAQKNRKDVAASIERVSVKQLDKMISGTEGRQLAVRRFEAFLDGLDDEGRQSVMDYLDWKYRVSPEKRDEDINGKVKDLVEEVQRLLDLKRR